MSHLDDLHGNFQQISHEKYSESRELEVDLTLNGLHEDGNPNGYEFRSLSSSNSGGNSKRSGNGPIV